MKFNLDRLIVHSSLTRDRSFDRIAFFRNLSVVLSKFVSKEKFRLFEYRHVLYVLSNFVLSNSKERNSKEKNEPFLINLNFG
jgi:hypothetical protein